MYFILLIIFVYLQRIKGITPRQSDMSLQELVQKFRDKKKQFDQWAFKGARSYSPDLHTMVIFLIQKLYYTMISFWIGRFEEEESERRKLEEERMRLIQRNRRIHEEQSEVLAKLDTGAIAMPIAKTAARSKLLDIAADREARRKQAEAAETKSELDQFDSRLAKMPVDEQAGYVSLYTFCSIFCTFFQEKESQ